MRNLNPPKLPERLTFFMRNHFAALIAPVLTNSLVLSFFLAGCAGSSSDEGPGSGDPGGGSPGVGGLSDGGGGTAGTGGGVIGSGGGFVGAGGVVDGSGGALGTGGGVVGSGGTAGGGGSLTGSGGAPGGDGGSNGLPTGGQSGFSTDRADFGLGMDSRCPGDFTICENFENTAPGGTPTGLTLGGYGTRTVGVSEAESARGARSLQIDINEGQSAVVAMLSISNIASLGAAHFGRMFYRILGPGVSEFVHFDVLEAAGPFMDHQNGVRFASTGTGVGTAAGNWSWIYNVQPFDGGGGEFGSEGDRSAHPVVDEWMCLEWEFDSAAQTATYYHDGAAIDYLVIDDEQSEIPVFTSISVGLQKFQSTGAFRVWIDEVALHTSRIGCNY